MVFTAFCKAGLFSLPAKPKTMLVMKLTTILILVGCLQVSAAGFAQKVSISTENAPLKKVFKEIKKQTGYTFFYSTRLLENAHNVSLSAKDQDLRKVLDECFKDQLLIYNIVNKTIVVSPAPIRDFPPSAQPDTTPVQIRVNGKITEAQNNTPLAGANIMVKGAAKGETSNNDGEFSILVKPGSTIIISYVGFQSRELRVRDNSFLSIKLSLNANKDPLANMVVTGYQVINKESFTGNTTVISGEDLKKVNPQNFLQSIQVFDPSFAIVQNNLAGSNPNILPQINVRGSTALPSGNGDVLSRTSLNSNVNLPTFIMDGFEVSLEKVYDLDVNRIQSVTLLKDAAATAIYGSRAANGVMVITTKAPKEGKLQMFYNYELNVTGPDLSGYHVLDARQKLDYEMLAGLYKPVAGITQDDQDVRYYAKNRNVVSGVNTYWLSQPLRTTFGHKHTLYLEGGSNSVRYGLDLRYQTSPGVMKGSTRDRYTLGMDLAYNPNKVFLFKNVLTVNQVNSRESPYGGFSTYATMNPYYPKTDSAGRVIQELDSWIIDTHGYGTSQYVTDVVLNPLYDASLHSFNKSSYLELIDAFSGEWNISKGLRLRSLISYTKKRSTQDVFESPLSNKYFFYPTYLLSRRGAYAYQSIDENTFDGSVTLNYNQQLGDHYVNLMMGSNIRTYTSDLKGFGAIGFTNDRFTNIGFANSYPLASSPGGNFSRERLFGALLGLNYSWKNKVLMDVNLRTDGSSKFGSDNKVAPFWAVGLGWNAHKEYFFARNFPAISQLRFRVSTGMTGSVSFPPYLSKTTYSYYSSYWYSTGVGASVNNYGNDALKWQRTRESDIGMDLGLFNDKLLFSPRYYYKITNGLLADINLPPSTGFDSYKANLGDMANRGFELNVKYTILQNKTWTVNVFTNLVHNTNKILKISDALKAYNNKVDQAQQTDSLKASPLLRYNEGQSVNTIYAVRSLGIDPENGKEIFIKKDGTHTYTWDVRDVAPVADPTPKVTGSFGTSIGYKRFLFNANFFTMLGGKDYNQTLIDRVENADPRYNVDSRVLADRWKKAGDKALFKNIADLNTSELSDRFIQKDNELTLQSVYLSYDLVPASAARLGMRTCRLAFTMNDVFHWSTMKIERGIDYPYARSFTFSVQTSF